MGYTHYWRQTRDISLADWPEVSDEISTILNHAEHNQGVRLGNAMGDRGSAPEFGANDIMFNGSGDDSHETFVLYRKRPSKKSWQSAKGNNFCKTARKPYDIAVTACLCYLASVRECFTVSSDGHGRNFLAGLELARLALPRYANILDIPRGILEDDRWCSPWPLIKAKGLSFRFCLDGHAYVMDDTGRNYRFETHREAADFCMAHPDMTGDAYDRKHSIFDPMGSFDQARWTAIGEAQAKLLWPLIWSAKDAGRDIPPPLYARPGEMPEISAAYSFRKLLELA